jgi:hypothetical protein
MHLDFIIMGQEGTEIIIMPENFTHFWTRVGEFTSSSMSGVHYGHYKAAIKCDISTKMLAQQLTVVSQSGIPPKTWSIGLQVTLEKIAEVCLVEKLRAIQLYEADFNATTSSSLGKPPLTCLTA